MMPGRSTNQDNVRARAYCVCSRCGWGLFRYIFSLAYHFFFLSPPLSGMDEWAACGLSPFQQNLSDIRMLSG